MTSLVVYALPACGALAVGSKLWIASARNRGMRKLSLLHRLSLAALIVSVVPTWWLVDRALQELGATLNASMRHDLSDQLDIPTPTLTSFTVPQWRMIGDRRVLLLQTPARMEWPLSPSTASLSVEYGFDPTAYEKGKTNGADFVLELVGKHGSREILNRHLDPRAKPEDRGLQTSEMVIPAFEEGAKLVLRTEPGAGNDAAWDWLCLYRLKTAAGEAYHLKQYPNFNRLPIKTEGDNSFVFKSAEGKPFLLLAAPSVLTFDLTGREQSIVFDYGFLPSAFTNGGHTDGASFRLEIISDEKKSSLVFERTLLPVEKSPDRELQHSVVALPSIKRGDKLVLSIVPGKTNAWDHTYVSLFEIK